MNKLLMIYSCVLLGSAAVANDQQSTATPVVGTNLELAGTFENNFTVLQINAEVKETVSRLCDVHNEEVLEPNLGKVEFVGQGNKVDPVLDLNSTIYFEDDTELNLGFDTANYLPEGFDPYTEEVGIGSINYMEDEEIDLGFDTADYLPEGFSPYETRTAPYIKEETTFGLGLDYGYSFPRDFDPYADPVVLTSINFVEDEEIDLGFDTAAYLPKDFDPYARAK